MAFFDYKTLGGGNYIRNIQETIDASAGFLLLHLYEALSKRIQNSDDIIRKENVYAFRKNKHIVKIMLSGFGGFPRALSNDIAELPPR